MRDRDNDILLYLLIGALAIFGLWKYSPQITGTLNQKEYEVKKVDEKTSYKIRKEVEDTARSMVSSYKADKLSYEQYKDSKDDEQKSWAQSYKQRANNTATKYNEYILKNSYVWDGNVPEDIEYELEVLK
ncbi:hypothetical protein [Streptococcus sp. S784/96/1]|uniref:hypothetical protein n=1 Tax=Streptococcus sp. S784/96/1 TaxID=2653499 RepID=UPI001389F030|nr:hypothetical protein [Streptococcus sp. S784/96/1]